MTKATAWASTAAVTAIVVAVLLFIASMRYSIALVDPPLPVPDYAMEALIAYLGCGLAVAAGITTGVVAGKRQQGRGLTVATGSAILLGIGALAAVAALTIPTL
ncbi:hypothetical protein GCM10009715_00700 [Paeniglutamicibacter psychrophenolicus]|uniref:Uncharacterized protein n=1 Tax=Paeniglutamicibacter psychrophenolicus TaxID=257454 RepID=A0ABS4WBL6_9MICC|nr:hypothetical protein [Paeniglutamicibacter psychrophenolicus]MBP2373604.1 hypothetical protein [Paeniglutamicibacter psychrophenolicus]